MYQIINARVITPFEECGKNVIVKDGCFAELSDRIYENLPSLDAGGKYLAPGFVDIHVHGGGGYSLMSGSAEDVRRMCLAHAIAGTTSILPTTLASPAPLLERAAGAVRDAAKGENPFRILGLHMEGPCLNPLQAGAQAPGALKLPCELNIDDYLSINPDIRIMGAAPELEGGMELGEKLMSRGITASIAHSNATYYEAEEALSHGYSDITHLYSCLSGIVRRGGFRIPGGIEAGLNLDGYTVQVIADGRHLPRPLLQLIYRCRGAENIILITDGLEFAASDMKEGEVYTQFNGVQAVYEDGVMKLTDRSAFAGSVATMNRLVRNMKEAGVPLAEAVRMATYNPAKRVRANDIGRIHPGYKADFVLFDDDINVSLCCVGGKPVTGGDLSLTN